MATTDPLRGLAAPSPTRGSRLGHNLFLILVLTGCSQSDQPAAPPIAAAAPERLPMTVEEIVAKLAAQEAENAKVRASPDAAIAALVHEPGWLACMAHYKGLVKGRGEGSPNWYRFAGGVCAQELPLRYGDLFMMIKKPDGFFKRKDFEQSLESALAPGSDVVCSDRLGRYADWLQEKMRQDPRCIGFPGVKSIKPGTPGRPPTSYVFDKVPLRINGAPIKGSGQCTVSMVAGMEKKYVTWHGPAGIYALNGPALSAADQRGWKKGPDTFSPSQMQQLLALGLAASPSMR